MLQFNFDHSPSLVLSLIITETSEITSTTNAKLQTMLINVSPRSKPVRRLHQFGFLIIKNILFVINSDMSVCISLLWLRFWVVKSWLHSLEFQFQ